MSLSQLFLPEFDAEMKSTRTMLERLERLPADRLDFAPHVKSMLLRKLVPHLANLPRIGEIVLTAPALDFGLKRPAPLPFGSVAELLAGFDAVAAAARQALTQVADAAWSETWKLSFHTQLLFEGSRLSAYRRLFLNHLVHHRAQLGVYLRLNDVPVPPSYGPTADETGF